MVFKVVLFLDRDDVIETFETLCSFPYEKPTSSDMEPPTRRVKGIESLIEQLESTYTEITEDHTVSEYL